MYLLLLFLVVSITSSSISFVGKPPKVPPKEGEIGDFFWRPATKDVVKMLTNSMNESADPCDDFYEFACGNFGENTKETPADQIEREINDEVKEFLINKMPKISDSKVVQGINSIMQACLAMNRTQTMAEYYEGMQNYFKNKTLNEMFIELTLADIQTSFQIAFYPEGKGDYYLLFYPPSDAFSRPSLLPQIYQIIDMIIKDGTMASKVKDYTKNLTDIQRKETLFSYPKEMLKLDVDGILAAVDEKAVKEERTEAHLPYLTLLEILTEEMGEDVARAHALMKVTFAMAIGTTDGVLLGGMSREDACVTEISNQFPAEVMAMLADELLPDELRDGVKEIFDNVLDTIVDTLGKQKWLGNSAAKAIKKSRENAIYIGLPHHVHNYTSLDSIYEPFIKATESQDILEQWRDLLMFKQREKASHLRRNEDDVVLYSLRKYYLIVNALHMRGLDLTMYTSGILQSPLFNYRFPDFFNYGLLGFIFGHEYGHGLANDEYPGSIFTSSGNVSESTVEEYQKRAKCMAEQVDNDVLEAEGETFKMDGMQYLNENLADNSGLDVAFKAYKKVTKEKRRPKRLREFDQYTNDQLFFISSAQFFCDTVDAAFVKSYADDPHAPGPIRVNAVRNSDDFATAFKCPVGSKMNPQKKCRLWD